MGAEKKGEEKCGVGGHCTSCGWPAALGKDKGSKTRIVVRAPKGCKDPIYLRGDGAGLSWNKGIRLDHGSGNEWSWETWDQVSRTEFKVLINDKIWEEGPNHVLECGKTVEYSATFPA